MQKLLQGIIDFHEHIRPEVRDTFAQLALGQKPDTIFIACSDSRVVPNLFASTNPGDLFVIRNIGNLIPPYLKNKQASSHASESAAVEFSLAALPIRDIVVCGHSECSAISAALSGHTLPEADSLRCWLQHIQPAINQFKKAESLCEGTLLPHNRVSQLNVLAQIEHLRSYPQIKQREAQGDLRIHGWWFDIGNAEVQAYFPALQRFDVIDEAHAEALSALFI